MANPSDLGARFSLLNDFVDRRAKHLPASCIAVWVLLFRHATPDGVAHVGQARLAEQLGVSRQTVSRAVGKLKDANVIRVKTGKKDREVSWFRLLSSRKIPE